MTPTQQRIAIAEACGLTNVAPMIVKNVKHEGDDITVGIWSDDGWVPQYLNDLNAMQSSVQSQSERFQDDFDSALKNSGKWVASMTAQEWADIFILCLQSQRELNAANNKIELLMSANADVARIAGERDAAEKRIRLLIAERDTARLQTDQKHSLREEFRELLGTDDIEVGVAVVREMRRRIKRLKEALDLVRPHCDSVHHSKKHQHQYGEPCPVVALIENVKEAKL